MDKTNGSSWRSRVGLDFKIQRRKRPLNFPRTGRQKENCMEARAGAAVCVSDETGQWGNRTGSFGVDGNPYSEAKGKSPRHEV